MLMGLRAFLIAAAFVITSCTSSMTDEGFSSPQALLDEIYDHYGNGENINYGSPEVIEKYFAPEIAEKIMADNAKAAAVREVPILNGDPFIDAQDWEITDLAISIAKSSTSNATIGHVTFKNFGEAKKINLLLQKTMKGWQVADIDSLSGERLSKLYGIKGLATW